MKHLPAQAGVQYDGEGGFREFRGFGGVALAQEVKGLGEEERVTSPNFNNSPSASTGLNNSLSCLDLKSKLKDVVNKYKNGKVIAVPRPNLDSRVTLTAWGRIDKLSSWDGGRAAKFIEAFTGGK